MLAGCANALDKFHWIQTSFASNLRLIQLRADQIPALAITVLQKNVKSIGVH